MSNIVSAAESAYARILRLIVSGELAAGDKLREEALCKDLQLSRTPLREALLRLEHEGLVERRPRYGCTVREVMQEEIIQLFECRAVLESQALRMAIEHIPQDRVRELLHKLDETSRNDTGKSRAGIEIDTSLHSLITASCPNRVLAGLIDDLLRRCRPFRNDRSYNSRMIDVITRERRDILIAISQLDSPTACRLLQEHIMQGCKTFTREEPLLAPEQTE